MVIFIMSFSFRDLGGVIGLIVVGGAILSVSFPESIKNLQWFGWVPLVGGIIYLVIKVKNEISQ